MRDLPDGTTVAVTTEGKAVVLNASASVVLYLADGSLSIDALAEQIQLHSSGATIDQVREDVRAIVATLQNLGCLEQDAPCSSFAR